jgi:hypothetical protein
VRRIWIAIAALIGFVGGFVVAFLVGIEETGSSECDGPCFEKWDEVEVVAIGVGVACAALFGLLARRLLARRGS